MTKAPRPPTRPQRIARRMRKDAERQAARRQSMAEARRPDTHAVDRAVSEALAYVAVLNHPEGTPRRDVVVPLRDVLKVAGRILTARGQFDAKQAIEAIVARTGARPAHRWTLPAPERPQRDDIGRESGDTHVTSSDDICTEE